MLIRFFRCFLLLFIICDVIRRRTSTAHSCDCRWKIIIQTHSREFEPSPEKLFVLIRSTWELAHSSLFETQQWGKVVKKFKNGKLKRFEIEEKKRGSEASLSTNNISENNMQKNKTYAELFISLSSSTSTTNLNFLWFHCSRFVVEFYL